MKRLAAAILLALVLAGSPAPAAAEEYIMNPGDRMIVTVAGYEEYSNTAATKDNALVVRPDGKISFPLVGTIDTTGKTIKEFTAELQNRLSEYLVNPDVSVNLIQLGTTRVFVLGEVNKAGMYELTKSHRVLDAIGAANGFTQYAAKKHIYLIRDGSKDNVRKLNLNNFLTKGDLKQNVVLKEGDCLYLTSNNKLDFAKDIFPYISSYYYIDRIAKGNDD